LNRTSAIKPEFRTAAGRLAIRHATLNNLRDVSVDIPTGVLTVVTGEYLRREE
jgi:excinuclease UvrABC ATPase subunit